MSFKGFLNQHSNESIEETREDLVMFDAGYFIISDELNTGHFEARREQMNELFMNSLGINMKEYAERITKIIYI